MALEVMPVSCKICGKRGEIMMVAGGRCIRQSLDWWLDTSGDTDFDAVCSYECLEAIELEEVAELREEQ